MNLGSSRAQLQLTSTWADLGRRSPWRWRGVPGRGEEERLGAYVGLDGGGAPLELWRLELWSGAPTRELPIAAGKGDQRGDLALDWSGAGNWRGRAPEMWTTEEPGGGEERWRKTTESWRREGAKEEDDSPCDFKSVGGGGAVW